MDALRTASHSVLRELLDGQPDTPAKVRFAWRIAAGPALGRAAATSWSDGVLRLRPQSAAWEREIRRARPMLTERLRQLLGPDTVRSIVIESIDQGPPRRGRPATS